ncbi:MAG: cellulase family glycosylhydrolase, partial [Anaerolineae bacterium]|nr:cellulase family glycosylhydrolase [Anaerolineae bacterium]
MQSSLWRWIMRGALLAALATLVIACSPTKTGQVVEPTEALPAVTRTPKPTFTPLPPTEVPTPTPTEAPTLAPTATPKPVQAEANPSATPSDQGEGAPTEAPSATSTAEPPTPTAEPPTATPPPAQSARMASPEYGMQAFMWWRPEVASRDLQMIKAAGFGWVKVNFGWRDIEGGGKGVYDWSRTDKIIEMTSAEGMKVLVRIDHQPQWAGGGFPVNGPPDNMQHLADFFSALAGRYRGKIHAYEVWNEPNLAREWGGQVPDPTGYVQMLKTCYGAIKAADPNAIVVSAGLSPTGTWNEEARPDEWYLATMYELMPGGSRGHFDVLGAHGPGFKYAPEADPAVVAQ